MLEQELVQRGQERCRHIGEKVRGLCESWAVVLEGGDEAALRQRR
jgi:hypothetical protein